MKYFIVLVIVMISNTFLGVAKPMKNQAEIYFAGGCFWGTEHFLKQIRGVESTQVGYANSNVANPSYEQVCSGKTNAAETVKVVYDPKTVDLNLLLDLRLANSRNHSREYTIRDGHVTRVICIIKAIRQ